MTESESDTRIKTDIPYLALTGKLWGVYSEDFEEKLPRHNGIPLYLVTYISIAFLICIIIPFAISET